MAEKKYIVTITRQFGSLGRPIAREMSEILGIEYYDRDIVEATSKKMNLPVSKISEHEETYSTSLFPMLLPLGSDSIAKQDEIYNVQKEVIREMAEKESCIIVGRCADYVLKENPNVVSVFIHADKKFCLERALERNSMTEKEMQKYIEKTDRFRGDFYRYHTGNEWADARNYDLCLNSGKLGFQKCVEEIKSYIKIRFNDKN